MDTLKTSRWTNRQWPVWLVAFVTLANGVISILAILLSSFIKSSLFGVILPFGVYHWSDTVTVAFGFILIYLSYNLLQRRRVAWWLAMIISVLVMLFHVSTLSLWPTILAPAVTLVLLIIFRNHFRVRSEVHNIRQGFILLGISIIVAIGYGILGFWLLSIRDSGITFSFFDALVRTLRQFTLLGNHDLVVHTRFAVWFLDSLNFMGILAGVFAVYSLFRPVVYRLIQFPQERALATSILEKYGKSTFDYFKVMPDKSFFFSPSHESFCSYRISGSVVFCLGDPVGPDWDRETIIQNFFKFCEDNGRIAAMMLPDDPLIYKRYGLSLLRVGEEAIVDLQHFAMHTYNNSRFRRLRRVFEREGYRVERYKPPVAPSILNEAQQVSQQWMTLPHRHEYGFFQGRFDKAYMEKCTLCVLRDRNGGMVAFINEVPSYRPGEASFDLMRYIPSSHWGAMDYLFAQMMIIQKNEGYSIFNFSVAPFVGIGDRPDATLTEKAVNQILGRLDWLLHSEGIKEYKIKFEPQWKETFVAYQGGPVGLLQLALNVKRIL